MFSKETKEKIAYWGTKLECPVDDDANYENTYVSSSSLALESPHMPTFNSGVIVILFQSRMTDEHGPGKASQDTGSLREQITRHGQQDPLSWL
jgi:hypothetical protein